MSVDFQSIELKALVYMRISLLLFHVLFTANTGLAYDLEQLGSCSLCVDKQKNINNLVNKINNALHATKDNERRFSIKCLSLATNERNKNRGETPETDPEQIRSELDILKRKFYSNLKEVEDSLREMDVKREELRSQALDGKCGSGCFGEIQVTGSALTAKRLDSLEKYQDKRGPDGTLDQYQIKCPPPSYQLETSPVIPAPPEESVPRRRRSVPVKSPEPTATSTQ